jgi:hypothetical protein
MSGEKLSLQMFREYWARSEGRFAPEFRHFINDIVRKLDAGS